MYHLMEASGFLKHHKQGGKITMPLSVFLVLCLLGLPAKAKYGGGTGEPNDPYLIYTAEHMSSIGTDWKDWDKHFKLMADIDLSAYAGRDFKIIGRGMNNAFKGVFDGNGKKILNFIYVSTSGSYTGIFGYVRDSDAEIKNLGLIDPNIEAGSGSGVGALAGWIYEGNITNCYVKGGNVSGKKWIGGLVGYNRRGIIKDCYSTCSVSGNELVGGLVGYHRDTIDSCYAAGSVSGNQNVGGLVGDNRGTITNSYAAGMVLSDGPNTGGLVGDNSGPVTNCSARGEVLGSEDVGGLVGRNSGKISGCDSSGSVSGENDVGGLVGSNRSTTIRNSYATGDVTGNTGVGGIAGRNQSTIINCYSLCEVTGTTNVGGLVGENGLSIPSFNVPGTIINCYSAGGVDGGIFAGGLFGTNSSGEITASFWDIETSGQQTSGGGMGKTTAEMQMANTFLDAGWDFAAERVNGIEEIWSICEGQDYPKLALQFLKGDFDGDRRVLFADFAVFAASWLQSDSSFFWCHGADLTNDDKVDFSDLKEFAENWLAEGIWTPMATHYISIDDFESYNDLEPNDTESNRIFDMWLDGYGNSATNGALVGHATAPYAEPNFVHGGRQSMPYSYSTLFKFSKAELPLNPPQDWLEEGAEILSLWFRGDSSNTAEPMSFVVNGSSAVYHDNPNAARIDTWTQWTIELQAFVNVDLSNVNSIAICFGDENNIQAGGSGQMYFDDILLYRPR